MRREFDRYNVRSIHSVKNRSGCERVFGSWEPLHEVCVIHEFADRNFAHGWTAPVRGAYFYWFIGSLFNSASYKEHYGGVIGAVRIENDLEYPEHPSLVPTSMTGIFYEELIPKKGESMEAYYARVKTSVLHIASDAMKGKAGLHDMVYYTQKGDISHTAASMQDDIGYPPCPGCMPYAPEKLKPAPFQIRR